MCLIGSSLVFSSIPTSLTLLPRVSPTIPQPHISSNKAVPTNISGASSSIPAASFFSINNPPAREVPLPLLSVSADVDVHGRICTTKVTQQFSNALSTTSQNVKYVFPIYDGWVVTTFRCWIGNDKLLEGAVKAKEAARADFKHAVSQRKVAVLVEELTPEVFETSVGNIPAQTTVKVKITYANLLKVDNSTGGLVLTIPTSIAPRYGVLPPGYSGNQSLLTEGLRINVQVSMPAAIRKMESRSHPISIEMGAVSHKSFKNFAAGASSDTVDYSKGQATLSDRNSFLHQDFVLHILCSSRESSQSRAIAATQPGQPALSTIAVTLHPGDLFRQRVKMGDFGGEIIFMADRSGSMRSKIPSLINVMNIFLRSLPEGCSFNIASFGSEVTWLWPSSKRYSQENLDVASKHVDSFLANYGGTEIYGALHSVLDHYNKQNDVPTNVILLTDGEVWDVDRVIQLVRRMVSDYGSNIRFFSLGIGDRVSHRLVEGIGQQGGGYAEVVPESSMGSWQERVVQMLKAALTPSRLQCNVDLGKDLAMKTSEREIAGYGVQYPEWVQAPHHIPVLNTFSHYSLYYMVEGGLDSLPKMINITATTDKGQNLTAQLPIQTVAEQPAIHHLAAKALMNDYETGQSWLHSLNPRLKSSNPTGFEEVLEKEAVHLGQRWSIPSKWTSYVAIDRTTAQQHAISVHKADAIEVSQLTRPRNTYTLPPPPPTLSSQSGSHGRGLYGRPEWSTAYGARRGPVRGVTLGGHTTSAEPARNNPSPLDNQTPHMDPLASSKPRRELSPGDSISQTSHRRDVQDYSSDDYSSDDRLDRIRKETREYNDRPHHRRGRAQRACIGIGAAELIRNDQKKEGVVVSSGLGRLGQDVGDDALSAVAVNAGGASAASRAREYYRRNSCHRSHLSDTPMDESPVTSACYVPSSNTFGSGVGIPAFDCYDNQRSQTLYLERRASPPPEPKSQDEEVQLFEATESIRDTKSSSLSTHPRGSDNEAPDEECPMLKKKLKANTHKSNWAINTAESGRDSRRAAYRTPDKDGESASGVQFSQGAVFDDFPAPFPSSDLDESRSNWPDSSNGNSQLSSNTSSNDREVRDPDHTPPLEFPALETILRVQQADGKFNFLSSSFMSALRQKYGNALEEFLNSRFDRESQATRSRVAELSYNILTVVYITDEHDASKPLWELQVAKAQQWIERTIVELLKESGDAEERAEILLKKLVDSIREEMEKRILQET
ncbi:hypothetical protein CFD26_107961 [Aspergillus turcosus]|uniref:VWFA domain-containing protein n=1 Tax=Aspergillus turcosus TaxID=1245748 RepID=A0A421DD39_9EURO|nr:hypothetical protein CFD26_107961 [Aspergillus turcosus]